MSDRDTLDTPMRLTRGDDLGAALLASARGDAPMTGARARTAAALGLGIGVAVGGAVGAAGMASASGAAAKAAGASIAPKALGAGTSLGAKAVTALWLKLLAAGVVTVAVAGGVAVKVRQSNEHADLTAMERGAGNSAPAGAVVNAAPRTNAAPRPNAAPLPNETPLPNPSPVPEPAVPVAAVPSSAKAATRAVTTPPSAASTSTSTSTASSTPPDSPLARELRSLDGARSSLGRGDAAGALAELDRHDRAFPAGSLRTEAKMLRVEALLARGDRASARRLATELLARDPSGPHARRLRTIADAP